jgi:two-component system NtrC family sensor kinase
MKKAILIFAILNLFQHTSFSQDQKKIDSLQNELKKFEAHKKELGDGATPLMDSDKADILYAISKSYWEIDTLKATDYAQQCLSLSQRIGYKKGIGHAFNSIGVIYSDKGNYAEALKNLADAIKIGKESGYKKGVAMSSANIGSVYSNQYNYPEARKYYEEALKNYTEIGDKDGIANCAYSIGVTYSSQSNLPVEQKYYEIALKNYTETGNKNGIANCYAALGLNYCYLGNYTEALKNEFAALKIQEASGDKSGSSYSLQDIGIIYSSQQNFPLSITNYLASLKLRQEIGDKSGIADSYNFIGHDYMQQGRYSEAMTNELAAQKIFKEIDNKGGLAGSYYEIGGINLAQKNYADALHNSFSALNIYKEIDQNYGIESANTLIGLVYLNMGKLKESLKYGTEAVNIAVKSGLVDNAKNAYANVVMINAKMKDYKAAYESEVQFKLYSDSIFNTKNEKKLTEIQMQYDFDKKEAVAKAEQEKKDADTKRARNTQYFVIASLGILILAVFIIALIQFRNNKHKQKANLLLQQQKEKVESTLTELRSTQSQLIQSEKMASLGELTAGIAHEIQNPLNFVNNFSDVNKELLAELKEEIQKGNVDGANEIANDIIANEERISHHGNRADAIVKGMLQHSQSGTGIKEPADINKLADEYLRLAYHGLRGKDSSFDTAMKTDFDESIGKINIIPQDIGRVLLNLYNNAFYAVNEKKKTADSGYEPTISISTKKSGNQIYITVSDNGIGIPQKIIDKIFQPFFTTKPTGQGTGLGLSLSYDIVKAHGGEIKVSTKENEGSEFMIGLPLK